MELKLEDFDFSSLKPQVIPFTYDGKKYELREANSGAAKTFNNAKINRITFTNGKPSGLKNMGDLPALLVSLCAYDVETGEPVGLQVVDRWPERMTKKLYQTALDISGLRDEVSTINKEITEAFSRSDAPVSLQDVRAWVEELPKEFYGQLKDAFEPSEEEKAKNGQSSTRDTFL